MRLEPPVKRYLLGKLPSHATTRDIGSAFNVPSDVVYGCLRSRGFLGDDLRMLGAAVDVGLVDTCGRNAFWRVDGVLDLLRDSLPGVERVFMNQGTEGLSDAFTSLSVVASHFNVSGAVVGRWLCELGLRGSDGLPTKLAEKRGLVEVYDFRVSTGRKGPKRYRKGVKWSLGKTVRLLVDSGHPLDFDYEKNLRAKGRNSDVDVVSSDEFAVRVARDFVKCFNARDGRGVERVLRGRSPGLLRRVEGVLGRPGFITSGRYRDFL